MCWIWMLLYFNIPAPCSDSNSDESLTRNKRIPKPAATFLVHPSDVKPTEDITNLPELSTRNLADYIGTLTDNTPENALQGLKFLAEYGIIENDRTCVKCLSGMNLNQDSKIIHDKHVWRCLPCRRNKESSKISMRAGSFFENLKLTVVEVFYLAAEWIENPSKTVAEVSKQFGISHTTVVEVQEWFRQMTKQWFKRESEANPNMKLGGPGKIVEIDETCVYRAKHHRGRMLRRKTKWVFGMIERGSSKVVMFRVPNRSAATLLPIVAKYVEPGSKIISDGWAAYTGLSAMQFDHHWVNHKINFVDPNDRTIHTQTIESTWNALKTQLKARYGTPEERLDGHMYNYMWRRYYNKQKLLNRLIYEMKFYKRKSREEDDNEEFTDSEEDDDDDIDDDDDDDDDNINDSTMIAQPTSTPFVTSTVSHLPYSATPHRRRGHHKSTPQPARISSTLATDDAASPSSIPSTNTPSTTPVFTSTTFTPFSTSSRRRGHRSSTTPTASTYPSTNMAASPSPAVTPSTAESPVNIRCSLSHNLLFYDSIVVFFHILSSANICDNTIYIKLTLSYNKTKWLQIIYCIYTYYHNSIVVYIYTHCFVYSFYSHNYCVYIYCPSVIHCNVKSYTNSHDAFPNNYNQTRWTQNI
ncbi:hypothetical protein GCK72_021249 [Caenorhabditis remanei]|uniref:ISXO2-like transposase domain-containing protein n=1 Tax=Caenorhabditis remanei TaxID=31234 RepID=A0A6A5GJD3_CAERE|nr:hypothetical protein GCK72_021249 [Caenorhabditis remanei]KAF1754685.1 hypothetical protein GCK72_021249 [Caenorhabditis remanei]